MVMWWCLAVVGGGGVGVVVDDVDVDVVLLVLVVGLVSTLSSFSTKKMPRKTEIINYASRASKASSKLPFTQLISEQIKPENSKKIKSK